MAWRIDEAVIRGEIDNRERGRVTGRIWLVDREEPLALDLRGNCWRDLAGRRLELTNPNPKPKAMAGLAVEQRGMVGDLTASRRVRVPEIPFEQLMDYYQEQRPFPWHWGNSVYLEWFSERNGRVVIESADYELKIVEDAAWNQTPEQEAAQHERNAAAFTDFMFRVLAAAQVKEPGREDEDEGK